MSRLALPGFGAVEVDLVDEPCDAEAQLALEQKIFDSLGTVTQRLRVWRPLPALIATTAEASQPTFAAAAARAKERGLAVYVRRSGGGAVCLGPGMLVISHLYAAARNDIDAGYREFARSLVGAVATLGVAISPQQVATAYCDGRFDLAWNGRKVGGIAQRRRVRDGMAHVWIHAVLAVERESVRHPEAVTRFYSDLGSPRVADPGRATSLSACLSASISADGLLKRCSDAIAAAFAACAQSGSPALF